MLVYQAWPLANAGVSSVVFCQCWCIKPSVALEDLNFDLSLPFHPYFVDVTAFAYYNMDVICIKILCARPSVNN